MSLFDWFLIFLLSVFAGTTLLFIIFIEIPFLKRNKIEEALEDNLKTLKHKLELIDENMSSSSQDDYKYYLTFKLKILEKDYDKNYSLYNKFKNSKNIIKLNVKTEIDKLREEIKFLTDNKPTSNVRNF